MITPDPPRLPLVAADSSDEDLAPVFDVYRVAGQEVPGVYRALANAPRMLRAWTAMAWPLRSEAVTPASLRELVIMRVAQLTEAEAEWHVHWDMAVTAGVDPHQLAALHDWPQSDLFSAPERAALAYTDEMTLRLEVSDATFEELDRHFGPGEVVEITLTAAFYSCASRVLRALRVGPPVLDASRLSVMRGEPAGDPRLRPR